MPGLLTPRPGIAKQPVPPTPIWTKPLVSEYYLAHSPGVLSQAHMLISGPLAALQSLLRTLPSVPPSSLPARLSDLLASVFGFFMGLISANQSLTDNKGSSSLPSSSSWAYPDDIPGLRMSGSEEWPKRYHSLKGKELWQHLKFLAAPQTQELSGGRIADTLNFQPSLDARTQDRYVVKELNIRGKIWTFSGVFDGHLGDYTVDHVAYHLPNIVEEFLTEAYDRDPSRIWTPNFIADLFSQSIVAFDNAIANDVISLFEGGMEGLEKYSDAEIRDIINDQHRGGDNWKKARLCMYGCCSVVALVDPTHENLWIANLGDCQAIIVSPTREKEWDVEVMTTEHNGSNDAEIERVRRDHPEEPECVVDRRVLGALAPFRCLGDVPFKQPPAFSRRIIYNIAPGFRDVSPWETFLNRNRTPPYITAQPDVTHRKLEPASGSLLRRPTFLVLASDGFTDICSSRPEGQDQVLSSWAESVVEEKAFDVDEGLASSNRAIRLLWHALGGPDDYNDEVSKVLTLESDTAWIDDTSIVVQTLT